MIILISSIAIIIGIGMFIGLIVRNRKEAKEELLKNLFNNNEITSKTYKKYMDNL